MATTANSDADCTLREMQNTTNYDGGVEAGVLHFWGMETKSMECTVMMWVDFSAEIPSGDTINAATLNINVGTIVEGGGLNIEDYNWSIYRCRRADWVVSEATHVIYKTGNNWGTAGARNFSTDIDSGVSESFAGTASTGWWAIDVGSIVVDAQANQSQIFNVMMDGAQVLLNDGELIYYKFHGYTTPNNPYLSITHSAAGSNIKSVTLVPLASIKEVSGVAIANVKAISGVTN